MNSNSSSERRSLWGWAAYYWGNHGFTTAVIVVFFPIFFREYWSAGSSVGLSTLRLGVANALASGIVALSAPLLGAIADRGGHGKGFLITSAVFGSVMLLILALVPHGAWMWAVALYVLAAVGNFYGNVFGDAMVVRVGRPGKLEMTSAIGYFAGYAGGGVFLVLAAAMVLAPQAFGFSGVATAVRFSFALAALWWLVFTLPMLRWVPKVTRTEAVGAIQAARQGLQQFRRTLRHIASYRQVWMFLMAYWLYIDGVNTVIQMAVDYGKAIGLSTSTMIFAVLLVQFVGMPAALAFGHIGERIGPKRGILIGLVVYVGVSIYATQIHSAWQFYVMAAAVGLVQGGVQLLSRALYARLVPKERTGEFFGFYNMLGEFAAILGPLLIGFTSYLTRDPRLSILSVIVLFVLGGALLLRVDTQVGSVQDKAA